MAPASGTLAGSGSNQLGAVQSIFVDGNLSMFLSDTGLYGLYYNLRNYRIQKWVNGATNGSTVAGNGMPGSGLNQVYDCSGLIVDTNGNIYLSDATLHRVTKWAPNATTGVLIAGTGTAGSNVTQLNSPKGIWVDSNLTLFVADYNNHRVMKWTYGASTGVVVAGGQGPGPFPSQLNLPTAVIVDVYGNLFVLDSFNQRIQQWTVGATFGITVFDGSFNSVLATNSLSMSVDSTGNLYVANTNGIGVWKVTLISNSTCTSKIYSNS
jgi:sugar lactone lactonase YvrE